MFKVLESKHGADETLRRWRNCLAEKGTFATPEELAAHWSVYEYEGGGARPDPLEARAAALLAEQDEREKSDTLWLAARAAASGR